MASPNAGGFVEVTINGVRYAPAGEVSFEETNFEAEAQDNYDGTISRTLKPGHHKATMSLRDRQGASVARAIYDSERIDVSFVEKQMKRTVLMTGAFATGKPKRNSQTGELSDIEIACDNIRFVASA